MGKGLKTNAASVIIIINASSRADILRAHLKTHQCDYPCSDPSSLSQHLTIHSGEVKQMQPM